MVQVVELDSPRCYYSMMAALLFANSQDKALENNLELLQQVFYTFTVLEGCFTRL